MDPRLLEYYNRELHFMREMGAEFAQAFPKIAGRLGMEGIECADPYVERLLEGFAFLAARVHLRLDQEFPRFTQHLLEMVYPSFLAPTPSMAVVELQPDLGEGALTSGVVIPRGTALRSLLSKSEQTRSEYRTGHDVTLWPVELVEAEYLADASVLPAADRLGKRSVKAGIKMVFRTTAGATFDKLSLDHLPLYVRGSGDVRGRLYEVLLANSVALVVRFAGTDCQMVPRPCVGPIGFEDHEALLPCGPRSFQGYRLLHEYFAFAERFLFVELRGLAPALRRCRSDTLEVFVLLERGDVYLEHRVGRDNFALYCAPVINLFPKRADRIHLSNQVSEYHVIPDRTRPMDFEIYTITDVTGLGTRADEQQVFLPFYATSGVNQAVNHPAYYSVRREPRRLSEHQRISGARSSYIGTEVFVSLVDAEQAPYRHDLRQIAISALCTNRDLPLHMGLGTGQTDFTLETGAPVRAIRCVAGPTAPTPSRAEAEVAWSLISHLSLNYLSLINTDPRQGAAGLRDVLMLYANVGEATTRKQIEGVRAVMSRPITRRLPMTGPVTFGRGLEIVLTCDDSAFEGSGVFLLGTLLEQFFAHYVSLNSFTETVLRTTERGEIIRWPARIGQRPTL